MSRQLTLRASAALAFAFLGCAALARPAPAASAAGGGVPAAQSSSLTGRQSSLTGAVSDFNIEINLASDVLFDFDKAVLKPTAEAELQKAAEIIRSKGKGLIEIAGHTDAKGSADYNLRLSRQRAAAVRDWFEARGMRYQYAIVGKGASEPVAPNANADGSDNAEGRARNRRVTIVVNKVDRLGGPSGAVKK